MGLLDRITFTKHQAEPPESIDFGPEHAIVVRWPGGAEATIPAFTLRDACPCAGCVEEGTGRKLLDPASLPRDVHAERIEPVGNYAVKFHWSDGHDTGIYAWPQLRELSGLAR